MDRTWKVVAAVLAVLSACFFAIGMAWLSEPAWAVPSFVASVVMGAASLHAWIME